MDEKSIEAAARALANRADGDDDDWQLWREDARAAIAAYRDAEIDRLTAERETLKTARDFTSDEREGWESFLREFFEAGEINAENSALRAKLEVAERDAERYRWFRTHENWRDSGPYDYLYEEELDAAIDAARDKTHEA